MKGFSTNRLTAEILQQAHLQDLVELHLDHEVSRYLGGVRSPAATKAYLQTNMAHWDRHGFGLWVLRTKTGEFAGRAGIRRVHLEDVEEVEIAYTLKRALWGQGLASEIAEALTSIGLTHFKLPSLVGLVSIGNGASRHVLEKSGFACERTAMYRGEEVMVYRSPSNHVCARPSERCSSAKDANSILEGSRDGRSIDRDVAGEPGFEPRQTESESD